MKLSKKIDMPNESRGAERFPLVGAFVAEFDGGRITGMLNDESTHYASACFGV